MESSRATTTKRKKFIQIESISIQEDRTTFKPKLKDHQITHKSLNGQCSFAYVKSHDLFIVASRAEIKVFWGEKLKILAHLKTPEIEAQYVTSIHKEDGIPYFFIVYSSFEMIKVKIDIFEQEKKNDLLKVNLKFEKLFWFWDEVSTVSKHSVIFVEKTSLTGAVGLVTSHREPYPTFMKVTNSFDHDNNMFKGTLKPIFEFRSARCDTNASLIAKFDDVFVFSYDENLTVIKFSPRSKKILRKVNLYLSLRMELDFESEGEEEDEEEEEFFEDMDIDTVIEAHYIPASDILVLVTEGCKAITFKNVFNAEKRQEISTYCDSMRCTTNIEGYKDNLVAIFGRGGSFFELLDCISGEITCKEVKNINEIKEEDGLSLTPYSSYFLGKDNHLLIMDDELAIYSHQEERITNYCRYSSVNYFDIWYEEKSNIVVYPSEDRRGVFFYQLENKENLKFLAKFHFDVNPQIERYETLKRLEWFTVSESGSKMFLFLRKGSYFFLEFDQKFKLKKLSKIFFDLVSEYDECHFIPNWRGDNVFATLKKYGEEHCKVGIWNSKMIKIEEFCLQKFEIFNQKVSFFENGKLFYDSKFEGSGDESLPRAGKRGFLKSVERVKIKENHKECSIVIKRSEFPHIELSECYQLSQFHHKYLLIDRESTRATSENLNDSNNSHQSEDSNTAPSSVHKFSLTVLSEKMEIERVIHLENSPDVSPISLSRDYPLKVKTIDSRFLLIGYKMSYGLIDLEVKSFDWILRHQPSSLIDTNNLHWLFFSFIKSFKGTFTCYQLEDYLALKKA